MQINPRDIIIGILSVSVVIMGILLFKSPADKSTNVKTDSKIANLLIDSLSKQNMRLNQQISLQNEEKIKYQHKLDSLAMLPVKVEKTYKKEVNEIDDENVTELIAGFNQLFSDNGVK